MMRKWLLVGDAPAGGGKVLEHSDFAPCVDNRSAALIGGKAYCDKCKSIGTIAKFGGPYRHKTDKKECALENDILLCNCPAPPKIISLSGAGYLPQTDDRIESLGPLPFNHRGFVDFLHDTQNAARNEEDFVQYFEFRASDGEALDMHYSVHSPDGLLLESTLDGNGKTAEFPMSSPIKIIAWGKPI